MTPFGSVTREAKDEILYYGAQTVPNKRPLQNWLEYPGN